jgi:predicted HTH domain antitoxin
VIESYRRGTVSRGRAAELLGVSLETFLRYAGELSIPYINLTEDEWEAEKRAVRKIAATLPPSATRVG